MRPLVLTHSSAPVNQEELLTSPLAASPAEATGVASQVRLEL